MTDRFRSGIIGTGFIGGVHARAVRAAGGVLTAVSGSSKERAAEAADHLQAERPADSAEELVASDDVDVVHICTPNHVHAVLAEKVLKAGKHVVCEKPLATTATDAERLASLAAEAGVVVPRGPDTLSGAVARYVSVPAGHPQGYQDAFTAFVADVYRACGGDPPDGLPRFADGLRAARITAAVVESARSRTWMEVPG